MDKGGELSFSERMIQAQQAARLRAKHAYRMKSAADATLESITRMKEESKPEIVEASVHYTNPYSGLKATKKTKPRPEKLEEELFVSQSEENDSDVSQASITPTKAHNLPQRPKSAKGKDKAAVIARPFAPPKKRFSKKTTEKKGQAIENRVASHPASWYQDINPNQLYSRRDLETLKYVIILIQKCTAAVSAEEDLKTLFNTLRNRLHAMEFFDFLSDVLMKKSKVLEEKGLKSVIYGTDVEYPWDIRADAMSLHEKWLHGIIDPHLLRGVETKQGKSLALSGKRFTSHRLHKSYEHKKSCNYFGHGNIVNGQWWPLQICAMRDGAHGEIESGIHGKAGMGAFSVVLSGGGYSDIDQGDIIQYCGTSGKEEKASAGTDLLMKSYKDGKDIRVLRSSSLDKENVYRPVKGLRYDGLYRIIKDEILDRDTAMHRFTLRRRIRQDPIRCTGVEKRPTEEELAEYSKIRNLIGLS